MPQEDQSSTRARLMKAAIGVFAEKGYRDATVREICRKAGSSNINGINYYYGSKEALYREILELIFKTYDDCIDPDFDQRGPKTRLRQFIATYCRLLYQQGEFQSGLTRIFVAEMLKPSPFLADLVDRYNRPRVKRHLDMIRDLLGHDTPEEILRDCLVSISGQILYYSFSWPVFSRIFPDEGTGPDHERLAAHIYRFSMGGLMAIKGGSEK